MESNKGKPIIASVPSMSIRFNATSEEIDEIFDYEEDLNETVPNEPEKVSQPESSPRRSILPLLGKRSTSVDTTSQDASPPSDTWRFLSDIKGKITKSVEVKITEYKAGKLQEGDGSPKISKPVKDSKDNSSVSDSEIDLSESSISRTCGIASTTEGVEMSSDDETPSLSEEDRLFKDTDNLQQKSPSKTGIRQRFRVTNVKTSKQKEGSIDLELLEAVQKLNEEEAEIESGVDVLADLNISNFSVDDDNVLNIKQVTGEDIKGNVVGDFCGTVFSPLGYVDLRPTPKEASWSDTMKSFQTTILTILAVIVYMYAPLSGYINGFISGGLLTLLICFVYFKLWLDAGDGMLAKRSISGYSLPIVKLPTITEFQPLNKYEGWVNEYPEEYNPHTYHIAQTQSVYLRLQGNFLRISNTRQKIPKRAMWNESEHKPTFSSHRIYNLVDARVSLLPEGLAKVRHWSKKYPICVTLGKDQLGVDAKEGTKETSGEDDTSEKKKIEMTNKTVKYNDDVDQRKTSCSSSQIVDEVEEYMDVEESDPESKLDIDEEEEENANNTLDWCSMNTDSKQQSPDETRLYLFGRTDREKEDWYRRLVGATKKSIQVQDTTSIEFEYTNYMKAHKDKAEAVCNIPTSDDPKLENKNIWINALITRVIFDCIREEMVIQRLKERIQRKLASIRLPYFIQELNCEELILGTTSPIITGASAPELNDRGLWLDLNINYEGLIVVILQTKVNLLKLKQPQSAEGNTAIDKGSEGKSAIFHSDVDDSAESSTDDDSTRLNTASVVDIRGPPSNRSNKLMKMVDRITESKIFQAATENRYIKKAMQDISNTDLRLKVEFKKCIGTLVLNIPPPPSDRVWLGFRAPPELLISACPIVGERNISFLRVTGWIERKIYKEFQKIFVIPNMEDLPIPVMSPKLPE